MTAALDDGLTFTDLFCGAGGSIRGFVDAGLTLVLGANRSPRSIETVSTNHRNADFLCTDINHYDMRRLPRTRILWASVICTETSPAGGHQARHGQGVLALEELGHVPSDAYERTRACALDVVRAAEVHRYEAVVVENVVEFATKWELYDWWVDGMCRLGYRAQVVNVSAAHVHAEDNAPAPQWRDRIYIVFTRSDVPRPDLEVRPPSWCFACEEVVAGVQTWKRPDRPRIGKYGPQYLFRCPQRSCGHQVVEPFVLPAAAAIDLDDVGQRIGDRKRPLAANTLARIEWGIREIVEPLLASATGSTHAGEPSPSAAHPAFVVAGYTGGLERRVRPVNLSPLGTVVANDRGHHQLVTAPRGATAATVPVMVNANHDDDRVYPAHAGPLPARTTKIGDGVATVPFVTMARTNGAATGVHDEPLRTVATGNHHYLTTPRAPSWSRTTAGTPNPATWLRAWTSRSGRSRPKTTMPWSSPTARAGGPARPDGARSRPSALSRVPPCSTPPPSPLRTATTGCCAHGSTPGPSGSPTAMCSPGTSESRRCKRATPSPATWPSGSGASCALCSREADDTAPRGAATRRAPRPHPPSRIQNVDGAPAATARGPLADAQAQLLPAKTTHGYRRSLSAT